MIANLGKLILRVGFGTYMFTHALGKIQGFSMMSERFFNFLNLGSKTSLTLAIFGEGFCALLVIMGLFTRIATVPLVIVMLVAIFKVHGVDTFKGIEMPVMYITAFLSVALLGPGKYSVDAMIKHKGRK